MRRKSLLIAILILTHLASINSYIASIALWKKEDKLVAVLGDVHASGDADICHKQSVVPFLDKLANKPIATDFILEHQREHKVKSVSELMCISQISKYAYDHNFKNGRVEFKMSDIRRSFKSFQQMGHISLWIEDYINKKTDKGKDYLLRWLEKHSIALEKLHEDLEHAVIQIDKFKSKTKNIEVKQFFDDMIKNINELKKRLKIIEQYNQEIEVDINFNNYKFKTGSIGAAFFGLIKRYNFNEVILNSLLEFYLYPVRSDLADVFFVEKMMESQYKVDNTIIYVGNAHAGVINKLLLALGYNLIYETGDIFRSRNIVSEKYVPVSIKDLGNFFEFYLRKTEIK